MWYMAGLEDEALSFQETYLLAFKVHTYESLILIAVGPWC